MPNINDFIQDKSTYPDSTKITLADGVETTLGELRGGFLRQADYSRKTQELAEQRRQFDADRTANETALAQARDDLAKMAERAARGTAAQDLDEDAQIDLLLKKDPAARRLLSQIEAKESRIAAVEKRLADREAAEQAAREASYRRYHETTLAQLQQKDPALDRDALIRYAQENGIARLDVAYRDMTREKDIETRVSAAREEERKKAEEAAKRNTQPIVPLRRTLTTPLLGKDDPKTFDEAAAAAEADPEIQNLIYGMTG